jgi:hypothetical protein
MTKICWFKMKPDPVEFCPLTWQNMDDAGPAGGARY